MLFIAILLSLVCPILLRKYDLGKYINTFKARSQTSVNKHNPICGMCFKVIETHCATVSVDSTLGVMGV